MYDKVAVPLDGSVVAFDALGPGRRLALAHGAGLVLVTVATKATGGPGRATQILSEGLRRCAGNAETVVIEHDDAAVALSDFDASDQRTLVCMSTRGRGALRRSLLGSTALAVVQHSPYAVVLIGPSCDSRRMTPIDPLIVCLDGTPETEAALPWATRWAQRTTASITLLRVHYPTSEPRAGVAPSQALIDEIGYLDRIREQLTADHPEITQIGLIDEQPGRAIQHELRGRDDAVVVVATSHPGPTKDLLLGSTAADIIRSAHVPVLVVSKHGTQPPD